MPFTFSHPAIILPLTYFPGKWFSLTGLVIGSLVPDFEYFLRMNLESNYSHTIGGLFWFDLPLGLLLAFLFHKVVKQSLFDNLPVFFRSRFSRFRQFRWNEYFRKNTYVVIISLFIGSVSHLFWDSFTHDQGYFAATIPVLTNTVDFFGVQVPVLKILQHTSTLIGGIVIAFAIYKLPEDKQSTKNVDWQYWITIYALLVGVVTLRLITGLDWRQYGNLIVTVISATILSLVLTPVILGYIRKNKFFVRR